MTINRRAFFGRAAAAAVSAPVVARSALTESIAAGEGLANVAMPSGMAGATGMIGKDSLPSLQALLKEALRDRERIEELDSNGAGQMSYYYDRAVDLQIDSLRSVSVGYRSRMIGESRKRRAKAREVHWLDQRIQDLKKRMGLLGYLFSSEAAE